MVFAYIFIVLLQLMLGIFIFFLVMTFITGGPFVPSKSSSALRMIELAGVTKNNKIYDLGCGDGRILFLAAQKYATAVGYDLNPYLTFFVNIKARILGVSHLVQAEWKDLWKADISDADVVFVYLLPWNMTALAQKLLRELKPHAKVVTNSFIFPGWNVEATDRKNHIYVFDISKQSRIAKATA